MDTVTIILITIAFLLLGGGLYYFWNKCKALEQAAEKKRQTETYKSAGKDDPKSKGLLSIFPHLDDPNAVQAYLDDIGKPSDERQFFSNFSTEDSKIIKNRLMRQSVLLDEKEINDLAEEPESLDALLSLGKSKPKYPISIENFKKPDDRFRPKAMAILGISVSRITTVEEIDSTVKKVSAKHYFHAIDEHSEDYDGETWTKIVHDQAVKIAEQDVQKTFKIPDEKAGPEQVEEYYCYLIGAKEICERKFLSHIIKQKFLTQFKPVLFANLDYFHKNAINAKTTKMYLDALTIKDSLYPEQVEIQQTATVEKPAEGNEVQSVATNTAEEKPTSLKATTAVIMPKGKEAGATAANNEEK